jgi:hypothetical protein
MRCGGIVRPFLTSALDGGEWSVSRPGRLTWYILGKRLGGPHSWSGGCVVDKNLLPLPEIEPRPFSCSPSLYQLKYPGSKFKVLNVNVL